MILMMKPGCGSALIMSCPLNGDYSMLTILRMNKRNLKYYFIPIGYISSLITMEFFPNILSIGLFLLMVAGSIVAVGF